MYSDLDLLVYEDQFNEIIDYICSCFSLNKADNIGDYYRHEIKITVFWNGQEYTIEIKRRHRDVYKRQIFDKLFGLFWSMSSLGNFIGATFDLCDGKYDGYFRIYVRGCLLYTSRCV